ncbi:MAG TPA: hypothetical protein VGD83_36215, partial [Streptosporangiaceae bacterium]
AAVHAVRRVLDLERRVVHCYVLESLGLAVQLVSASQARNLKGRPKTDPLTDHLGVFSRLAGRVVMGVATVAGHERRRGWPTRSGPAGGAALRVA